MNNYYKIAEVRKFISSTMKNGKLPDSSQWSVLSCKDTKGNDYAYIHLEDCDLGVDRMEKCVIAALKRNKKTHCTVHCGICKTLVWIPKSKDVKTISEFGIIKRVK